MEHSRVVAIVAAVGLLLNALPRMSSTQGSGSAPATTSHRPADQKAASPQAAPETMDGLEALADSLGADITLDGLTRRLRRELRFALTPGARRADAIRFLPTMLAALPETSSAFTKTSTGWTGAGTLSPEVAWPALETAFTSDLAAVPGRLTDVQLAVLRDAAWHQGTRIEFLIATLPDPVDSFTGWQFDPMLEAISQAIAASNYVFERFHFHDAEAAALGVAGASQGRQHESDSDVIIYRKHAHAADYQPSAAERGDDPTRFSLSGERLVLLIVHENPSAGVHSRALTSAIDLVRRWHGPSPSPRARTIRILGPTFSGSADSIARELYQANRRRMLDGYDVRVISGSATDESNQAVIQRALGDAEGAPRVTFQATVQPDTVLLRTLLQHVRASGWPEPIAVLFEGNTQYGRSIRETLNDLADPANPSSPPILLPFPMNVSRIRKTDRAARPGLAEALGLPSRFRPLSMETSATPADQIPQSTPETTASYIELALSNMLSTLRREGVGSVALMATDARDKLFLAGQIARDVPNVALFTVESDALYVHPDYAYYLEGALVASTYPLYSSNQEWSYGFRGVHERVAFANGSATGIYNAALVLLNGRPESTSHEAPPTLLEYGPPGATCERGCQPPVWLTVIGGKAIWPLRAYPVSTALGEIGSASATEGGRPRSYTWVATPDAGRPPVVPRVATLLSPGFQATFLLLTLLVWCLVFLSYDKTWTARLPVLVLVSSLAAIESHFAAVFLTRLTLDPDAPFPARVSTLSLVALALAGIAALVWVAWTQLRHRDDEPSGWGFRLCALGAVALVGVAGLYGWSHVGRSADQVVGFVVRASDIGSGVSPTVPVILIALAFTLWGAVDLARRCGPSVALADERTRPLIERAVCGDVSHLPQVWKRLDGSTIAAPPVSMVVVAIVATTTAIFLFDPILRPLVSIEGDTFGRFVSGGLILLQVILGLALLQFLMAWHAIRQLLDRIVSHADVRAYELVPRGLFSDRVFPGAPRRMDLDVVVAQAARWLGAHGRPGQVTAMKDAFKADMKDVAAPWSTSTAWSRLQSLTTFEVLPGAPKECAEGHTLLHEMCVTLVVRDAIARLRYSLVLLIGGVVCVFCSHTLFPFQIDRHLAVLAWVHVGLTFGAIVAVLLQMKSNELLRRVASPDPTKRTGWDGPFVLRFAVLALLPLITLFAAQFPDIAGVVMRWVEPVKKVLP